MKTVAILVCFTLALAYAADESKCVAERKQCIEALGNRPSKRGLFKCGLAFVKCVAKGLDKDCLKGCRNNAVTCLKGPSSREDKKACGKEAITCIRGCANDDDEQIYDEESSFDEDNGSDCVAERKQCVAALGDKPSRRGLFKCGVAFVRCVAKGLDKDCLIGCKKDTVTCMKNAKSLDDKRACGKAVITCVKGCKVDDDEIADEFADDDQGNCVAERKQCVAALGDKPSRRGLFKCGVAFIRCVAKGLDKDCLIGCKKNTITCMKGASSFDDKKACGKAAITCVKGCKVDDDEVADELADDGDEDCVANRKQCVAALGDKQSRRGLFKCGVAFLRCVASGKDKDCLIGCRKTAMTCAKGAKSIDDKKACGKAAITCVKGC